MRITALAAFFSLLLPAAVCSQPPVDSRPLLDVSAGQLPNDTALEDKSSLRTVPAPWNSTLNVLQVNLAPGDSFGATRKLVVADWTPFRRLLLAAHNPSPNMIRLSFIIKHSQTRNVATRIELPIELQPGDSTYEWDLTALTNGDGTSPRLDQVQHWYFASSSSSDAAELLYISALNLSNAPNQAQNVRTDPRRVQRIRAAAMPAITRPVQFDSPAADAILSALEVFPPDNPWNQLVDEWPVHPDSAAIIASIGVDKPLRYNPDMAFVIVPPDQAKVPVQIVDYDGESDKGPFPIPAAIPIEGWPVGYQRNGQPQQLLQQVQQRPSRYEGDRHAIVVDPLNHRLYEFFTFGRTENGWAAGQASVFDLSSNALRPEGWTSADAAGLPIFPAVVRYDELQRGVIDHALRVTVRRSRRAYVYPATHFASRLNDADLPRMGERIRLRSDFDVSGFSPPVRAILSGLQRYGMLVADNGIEWAISVAPDPRIPVLHEELRRVRGRDFEVVVSPH